MLNILKAPIALTVISIFIITLASCNEQQPDAGITGRLSAIKIYQVASRSVPPNSQFQEGTKYRLWAYENDTGVNINYIFSDAAGVVGTESATHFIDLDKNENAQLRGDINIYGFTDGSNAIQEADSGSSPDNPEYTIRYNGSITSEKSSRNYIYTDYMRSKLNHKSSSNSGSSAILQFRHIMSQVRIQTLQQDSPNGSNYDLRIKDIALDGIYDEGTYNVITDKFSIPDRTKQQHIIWRSSKPDGESVGSNVSDIVQTLIFPTIEADRLENSRMSLIFTIEGSDASLFSDDGKVTVPIMDNTASNLPLFFESNCSYTLQVVFIGGEVRIVTLIPQLYPWLDGETDSGNDYDSFLDKDIASPAQFDNLLWSAYNEGAEVSVPKEDTFMQAIGFFYQSERNIPFYPWLDNEGNFIDYNTKRPLSSLEGAFVYPAVLNREGKRVYATANNLSSNRYIVELDDLYDELENGKSASYCLNWSRTLRQRIWDDPKTQPTPPGWRMPTEEEYLSIMPSTPHAGNITFLRNLENHGGGGNIGTIDSGILNTDLIYIHVPNDYTHNPNYPSDSYYDSNSSPRGNVIKQTGDPARGYSSEYIISKRNRELDHVDRPVNRVYPTGDAEWGSIYAIKKVGTSEAYRMRWHIESRSNNRNEYVLVVSRYAATASDRLTYKNPMADDYYLNYGWNNPGAILYFPIVGMTGDMEWSGGRIGNFGTETILATSTKKVTGSYVTFRIKISGDGRFNQYIHISSDRDASGAQIRCVRDYVVVQ